MAKITLEFDYYEDRDTLKMAQKGPTYLFALIDIANYLREAGKYHDKDYEEVREKFFDICSARDIDVYGEVE